MTFCAGCGSPNLDTDATCRVCGRSLTSDPAPPSAASGASQIDQGSSSAAPASSQTSSATAVADLPDAMMGWPSRAGAPVEPDRTFAAPTVTRPTTGVATPSGFESVPSAHRDPQALPPDDLPAFMRPAARSVAAPPNESASLISEHDLPEWIRQIAADDARKLAEAQVQEAASVPASGSSMPSHFGRRALPGETLTSGPASSSWLSRKDAVAGAAESAWDVTGAAPPTRRTMFPDTVPSHSTAPSEAPPVATDVVVADTVAAPSRRRRRGSSDERVIATAQEARSAPSDGATRGNQRRAYLAAAIVLVLVLIVALSIL